MQRSTILVAPNPMKSKQHITVIVLLVGIIAAALSLGAASPEKPSFEYIVLPLSGNELNKFGAEGWELVAVTSVAISGSYSHDTAYLKRLKR